MAELLSADKIALFIALFIPGFVILKIWDMFVAGKERDFTTAFPNVITYSVLHYALTGWPLLLLRGQAQVIYAYVDVLILPIAWPIMILTVQGARGDFGSLIDARCLAILFRLYRDFITRQSDPTPWDAMFRDPEAFWIRIRLKNNRIVGGRMLENSSTSVYPEAHEIFIAAAHLMNQVTGDFGKRLPSTAGLWVSGDEIETVELFRGYQGGKPVAK